MLNDSKERITKQSFVNENLVVVIFLTLIFLLIVLFTGTPDIHDAIIKYLMK